MRFGACMAAETSTALSSTAPSPQRAIESKAAMSLIMPILLRQSVVTPESFAPTELVWAIAVEYHAAIGRTQAEVSHLGAGKRLGDRSALGQASRMQSRILSYGAASPSLTPESDAPSPPRGARALIAGSR